MDNTFTFGNIFKKGFSSLDIFQKISFMQIFVCILVALLVSTFIFFIYWYTFRGVVYSYSFNVAILMMCLLTSLIILTISSNVVLSLGMVGALSIVRYRTALKDPMDIVFMFWAVAVGISTGAGIYSVSIIGSLVTGGILVLLNKYKIKDRRYMLIIHYTEEANDSLRHILKEIKATIKSKTITKGSTEINVEVRLKNDNTSFLNNISDIQGVIDTSLISYNGDYAD